MPTDLNETLTTMILYEILKDLREEDDEEEQEEGEESESLFDFAPDGELRVKPSYTPY